MRKARKQAKMKTTMGMTKTEEQNEVCHALTCMRAYEVLDSQERHLRLKHDKLVLGSPPMRGGHDASW